MQTDRSTLMAFMRTQEQYAREAKAETVPEVQTVQQTVFKNPLQDDRTSLRAAMDRIAASRNR